MELRTGDVENMLKLSYLHWNHTKNDLMDDGVSKNKNG